MNEEGISKEAKPPVKPVTPAKDAVATSPAKTVTPTTRHTTTTPPPQPPTSRASTTVTNSNIQDQAAPVDQLPNASPLKTVVKSRKKRKKITCPPPRRRQPTKRTITEITRRTDLTPGVRRSNRPNIKRVPIGGYVEYKDHWGNTPSNTYGREAVHIVNPIPSPAPRSRRNTNNKRTRDEEDLYLSFASPDDPENIVRHHILFPLSQGQLCNVDGMDLQPGDDLIINRVMGTDDYQKGEMELKKGSEKPMAQNGNCEMVFRVLKGKVLAVLEDQEVEVGTDEYVLIPPGTAYQLNNVSRSNTIIDYTVIMKK